MGVGGCEPAVDQQIVCGLRARSEAKRDPRSRLPAGEALRAVGVCVAAARCVGRPRYCGSSRYSNKRRIAKMPERLVSIYRKAV